MSSSPQAPNAGANNSYQPALPTMLASEEPNYPELAINLEASDNLWMRLIERESQLAALRQYANEAGQGQGRLVLISGEAGVGKSVLLEEFAEQVKGGRWLWAGCDGLFTPAALGPLLDLASQLDGDLLRLCRGGAKRDQLYGALLRQLNEMRTLTAIVIEDVHWADEATLDLLSYLGRRIQHLQVLLLVTYRDDALVADDPLRHTLGALASQRATRRLTLPALTADGVATLAQGTGIDATELHRLTAGNSFFVSEVLQAGNDALPASIRDAVLARMQTLTPPARDAVDTAALVGSRMQSELLVSLVDNPLIMDELINHGLLIKDGDDLRFRHEIARVVIEAAIPPYRKAAIHSKIMDALLSQGCNDDARLAFHAEGAGRDDLVVRYGSRAGRRASELAAHREAAAQFGRALRSAMDTEIRSRAELSDALAHELALVDRWEESAEMRTAALQLWREAGDLRRESQSLLQLSVAMWRLCRGAESKQAREAALALAQECDSGPEIARAYERMASHWLAEGRYEEGVAMARQACEMAEQFGLSDVFSDALDTEAKGIRGMGGQWVVPAQAALESALSAGHEEQAGRVFARAYRWYCDDLRPEEAERSYGDAFAYCEEHDIGTFVVCLQGERTAVLEQSGRWDECISLGRALLDQHRLSPWNRLRPLCSAAKVMARRGEQGFWPYLDEAIESVLRLGEPEWIRPVGIARTEAYWLEGRLDAAISELDRVRSFMAGATAVEHCWVALWMRRLGGTAQAVGIEPFASQLAGDGVRAAMLWDRLGYQYEAALALLDAKQEVLLRESLQRLVDLGAEAAARVVRRTMRDLGIRSIPAGARTATRAHPRGLTTREQQILELLAERRSNEEISATLFISVRTVEHHISAILGKLGVATRQDAAKEAQRLDLTHSAALPVATKFR
jgi:DNA-binding CsgD family transcriptional regulator/tetratricopeptide (TPR) repeat protein